MQVAPFGVNFWVRCASGNVYYDVDDDDDDDDYKDDFDDEFNLAVTLSVLGH